MAKPRKAVREPADRICALCGDNAGREGPLPYCWDVHIAKGGLICTCSRPCRKTLGYSERKS